MIWMWQGSQFVSVDCPPTFESVIMAAGWEKSRSAAQKSIALGKYKYKRAPGAEVQVSSYKEEVPKGWPIAVLRHKPWPSFVEVMNPEDLQDIGFWSELWDR